MSKTDEDLAALMNALKSEPERGFALKVEPLRIQESASADRTPPDYTSKTAPIDLQPPFWRCSSLLNSRSCGNIWLNERKAACPCGGLVARVYDGASIQAWRRTADG